MSTVFFRFFRQSGNQCSAGPELDQLGGHAQGDLFWGLASQGEPHRQDDAVQSALGESLGGQSGAEKVPLFPAAQHPQKSGLHRKNGPKEDEVKTMTPAHEEDAVLRAGQVVDGEVLQIPAADLLRAGKAVRPGEVRPVVQHDAGKAIRASREAVSTATWPAP